MTFNDGWSYLVHCDRNGIQATNKISIIAVAAGNFFLKCTIHDLSFWRFTQKIEFLLSGFGVLHITNNLRQSNCL